MLTASAKVPAPAPLTIRSAQPSDRRPLHELVAAAGVFSPEEVACARELIDSALDNKAEEDGYKLLIAEAPEDHQIIGYVCYGRIPFTRSSFDLYWLATHPEQRRRGIARALCTRMEELIRSQGGTHVRVETSGTSGYGAAREFYERAGYPQVARIPDFYKPGDDLFTFCKRL
jgi:ribosomal protein S18 acetylase RimI-like enzyme